MIEQLGGIDILVNCAGVLRPIGLETDASARAVEEEVAVNLLGSLRMTRLALPHLRRSDDGAIVFLSKGIPLKPQWGSSGYRIDFVAKHPQQPGRLVLAIECDGASYHSTPTARDRDRLRQQQLEALGWRFHRIWSTDWFLRRDQEIEKVLSAYHAAVDRCTEQQAAQKSAEPVSVAGNGATKPKESDIQPVTTPIVSARRGKRPVIPQYSSIDKYRSAELVALVQWIRSDGLLRTDEEIVEVMVKELGFKRRGIKTENAVRRAISDASHSPKRAP